MDSDWRSSLNQIIELHEHGIECEINKTFSAFQSLGLPSDATFISCFFDIMKNRMAETCHKLQMAYLLSVESIEYVNTNESPASEKILVSVTSGAQSSEANGVSPIEDSLIVRNTPPDQGTSDGLAISSAELVPTSDNVQMVENVEPQNVEFQANDRATDQASNDQEIQPIIMDEIVSTENVPLDQPLIEHTATHDDAIDAALSQPAIEIDTEPETENVMPVDKVAVKSPKPEDVLVEPSSDDTDSILDEIPALIHSPDAYDHDNVTEISVTFSEAETSEDVSLDENSTSHEQPLLGFHAAQIESSTLKRKEVAECELYYGAVKKAKPSHEIASAEVQGYQIKASVELQRYEKMPVPKNIDRNVHCQNAAYQKKCVLCASLDECLVNHYRIVHPESDVFISRPSPPMVQRIFNKIGCTMFKDGKISAFCYFCEKSLSMCMDEWKQHLLSHTGEFEFYCCECRSQLPSNVIHGTCSLDNIASIFYDRGIWGNTDSSVKVFMCKRCNYIQVHRSRMIRHLEREHSTVDSNFNRNIEQVIFIPDLQPLTWEMSSRYEFVNDSMRYRCGIDFCSDTFNNFAKFKCHFNRLHNDKTTFICPHCNESIEKQSRDMLTDIYKHFKYHARYLLECPSCKMHFDRDFSMLCHIVRTHPTGNPVYRSIYIQPNGDIEKKEYTIWLQCNVCNQRLENIAKAGDHFVKAHGSHNMDFKVIKMVKRTTTDGTTSCFTPNEKKTFRILRWLVCRLCDRTIKTKGALVEHFNRDHSTEPIAVKLGKVYVTDNDWEICERDQNSFANYLVFYCATCRDDANSLNLAYSNVHDVHAHWLLTHSKLPDSRPFRFHVAGFVLCVYCKYMSSFEEVKRHSKEAHPNEPLIISNVLDTKACALCAHKTDNLGQHLKVKHELVLRTDSFNPTHFTDAVLSKLLAIDAHLKYRCSHCGDVFETQDEVQHHSNQHNEPFMFNQFFDNQSIKLIAGCCEATLDLHEFLDHLADPNHKMLAICTKCNFQSNESFEFVNHQVQVHQIAKDANSLYRRLLQTRFWSTKVIFGNGLVLTKHNLLGTEFDDSKPFEILVEALLAIAQERLYVKNAYPVDSP